MKFKKIIFFYLVLFFMFSCSSIINKVRDPVLKSHFQKKQNQVNQCLNFRPLQLVGTNISAQKNYHHLSKSFHDFDFLDHFALWSFLQMTIRTDQSSPSARFQVLMKHKGRNYYFDFFSQTENGDMPFLYGIDFILKKFKSRKTLEDYAVMIDDLLKSKLKSLKIDKHLANFLQSHFEEIKRNPILSSSYLRGRDVLRENESPPKLSYSKLVQHYRKLEKKHHINVNTNLTKFYSDNGFIANCNYDLNLYRHSVFLIEKDIPQSNIFGLAFKKKATIKSFSQGSSFLASTSQVIKKIVSLNKTPLFKGLSRVRSPGLCMIKNQKKNIWLISNQSRDPGQHLFHMIKYGINRTVNLEDISHLIQHSRHLFLSHPLRLIFESQRSSQKQIEKLLKLEIPIYNAQRLGNIWSYAEFVHESSFITDHRNTGFVTCP